MNSIILYSSKTNNTKKIALKLAEFSKIKVFSIVEVTKNDLENIDLIYLGGYIDRGSFNKEVIAFLPNLNGKKIAFFFTLGAYPNSVHAYDCLTNIKELLYCNNNIIISHYHCQGPISPSLIDWMSKLDDEHPHYPDEARLQRWHDASNHPNEEDYHSLKSFYQYTCNIINNEKI